MPKALQDEESLERLSLGHDNPTDACLKAQFEQKVKGCVQPLSEVTLLVLTYLRKHPNEDDKSAGRLRL